LVHGAKVIGFANAGADAQNAVKQAVEFGLVRGGQRLAALVMFITDIEALGLKTAQGLVLTNSFYWDLNDATRAWTKRFMRHKNRAPNDEPGSELRLRPTPYNRRPRRRYRRRIRCRRRDARDASQRHVQR
jgi:hypothetical protein